MTYGATNTMKWSNQKKIRHTGAEKEDDKQMRTKGEEGREKSIGDFQR